MQLGHILYGLFKSMRGRPRPAAPKTGCCEVPAERPDPTPAVIITPGKQRWAIQPPSGRLFQVQAATKSEARAKVKAMLRDDALLSFTPQNITRLPVGTVAKRSLASQAA